MTLQENSSVAVAAPIDSQDTEESGSICSEFSATPFPTSSNSGILVATDRVVNNGEEEQEECEYSQSMFSETSFQPDGRFDHSTESSEYEEDSSGETDGSDAEESDEQQCDDASGNVRQIVQQYEASLASMGPQAQMMGYFTYQQTKQIN